MAIDWTQKVTAATRLQASRARMVLGVDEFAAACVEKGHLTDAEALAWIKDGTLPAFVETALASMPEVEQRRARLKILAATEVHRVSPIVALVQQAKGLTHAQVDELFVTT